MQLYYLASHKGIGQGNRIHLEYIAWNSSHYFGRILEFLQIREKRSRNKKVKQREREREMTHNPWSNVSFDPKKISLKFWPHVDLFKRDPPSLLLQYFLLIHDYSWGTFGRNWEHVFSYVICLIQTRLKSLLSVLKYSRK